MFNGSNERKSVCMPTHKHTHVFAQLSYIWYYIYKMNKKYWRKTRDQEQLCSILVQTVLAAWGENNDAQRE